MPWLVRRSRAPRHGPQASSRGRVVVARLRPLSGEGINRKIAGFQHVSTQPCCVRNGFVCFCLARKCYTARVFAGAFVFYTSLLRRSLFAGHHARSRNFDFRLPTEVGRQYDDNYIDDEPACRRRVNVSAATTRERAAVRNR